MVDLLLNCSDSLCLIDGVFFNIFTDDCCSKGFINVKFKWLGLMINCDWDDWLFV